AYGLTAAEGKVLDAVIDGDGVDGIADRLGVARATVKTHLNRILAKTGTTRQNELIRLVAGTLPPLRG
ncbi:MAG TPA: helix-turn-helix transcriptional regulator, partial [Vineibacter sp.]|nr:helix-turn-helix transcriptional regulator [Vineibacter sp.]